MRRPDFCGRERACNNQAWHATDNDDNLADPRHLRPRPVVDGPIHEIFAQLRHTDPVHWQSMPDEPGYWAVMRHADVTHVARHPDLYSAEIGGVVLEDMAPEQLAQSRNMLLMMDPPRHTTHRKPLAAGDKVAMMYTSANRDDDVFGATAQDFDIRRAPNPHLSFGFAQHFCLGVHLARLEGRVFFDELLSTFATIEQTGPSRRIRSNLNNGLKHLPIHFAR